MEITGTIKKILPLKTGEGKSGTWKKQDIVIEYGDKYPKLVCISLWGEQADTPGLTENAQIKAFIDIQSREYQERWYTDVKAWKIELTAEDNEDPFAGEPLPPPVPPEDTDEDELPF